MTDTDAMRAALLKKLANPDWMAQKEHEYDRIVGGDRRVPIILDVRLPPRDELQLFTDLQLPPIEEATTIDGLWLDRWQRSSGAYTLTRLPDDTIRLDYPTASRYVYRVCRAGNLGFAWTSEEFDLAGRRINTRRTMDVYLTRDEALFEMHRAAISEFEEITNEY